MLKFEFTHVPVPDLVATYPKHIALVILFCSLLRRFLVIFFKFCGLAILLSWYSDGSILSIKLAVSDLS